MSVLLDNDIEGRSKKEIRKFKKEKKRQWKCCSDEEDNNNNTSTLIDSNLKSDTNTTSLIDCNLKDQWTSQLADGGCSDPKLTNDTIQSVVDTTNKFVPVERPYPANTAVPSSVTMYNHPTATQPTTSSTRCRTVGGGARPKIRPMAAVASAATATPATTTSIWDIKQQERQRLAQMAPKSQADEQEQMTLALEMSLKESREAEAQAAAGMSEEDILSMVINKSKEDYDKERRFRAECLLGGCSNLDPGRSADDALLMAALDTSGEYEPKRRRGLGINTGAVGIMSDSGVVSAGESGGGVWEVGDVGGGEDGPVVRPVVQRMERWCEDLVTVVDPHPPSLPLRSITLNNPYHNTTTSPPHQPTHQPPAYERTASKI